MNTKKSNDKLTMLTQAAVIAALAYIGFQFLRIDIPVGTEKTAFHLGNVFVVLGAMLLGPIRGGLAGAIGLTIADLTSGYVTSAPKTFVLKLLIGLIAGNVSHKLMHIETADKKSQTKIALFSSAASLGVNIIADPVVGYIYKKYIFGIPQDMAVMLAKISSLTTAVNSILGIITVTIIWTALYPALRSSGLLLWKKISDPKQ